jgi:hypothetical protein
MLIDGDGVLKFDAVATVINTVMEYVTGPMESRLLQASEAGWLHTQLRELPTTWNENR